MTGVCEVGMPSGVSRIFSRAFSAVDDFDAQRIGISVIPEGIMSFLEIESSRMSAYLAFKVCSSNNRNRGNVAEGDVFMSLFWYPANAP